MFTNNPNILESDELTPASEIEFELEISTSGRKFHEIRLKAIGASNLPMEAAKGTVSCSAPSRDHYFVNSAKYGDLRNLAFEKL